MNFNKNNRNKALYEHYCKIFRNEPVFIMKLKNNLDKEELKINTLVFAPTSELPFWKLCTIGASDYLMPKREIGFGRFANRRNEYMMFISSET